MGRLKVDRDMLLAANFHYLRSNFETPYPSIFGLTPEQFEHQIDVIGKEFNYVSAADIKAAALGERVLPNRACCLTFDDGLREQYEIGWDILQRKGIPAIFYINTGPIVEEKLAIVHKIHILRSLISLQDIMETLRSFITKYEIKIPQNISKKAAEQYKYDTIDIAEMKIILNFLLTYEQQEVFADECFNKLDLNDREIAKSLYMTVDMIRHLDSVDCIGSHAHNHVPLSTLSDDSKIKQEIQKSLDIFRQWGLQNVNSISYPYGGPDACSLQVGKISKELGLSFGFTMERAVNSNLNHPMFLSRYSNSDLPGGGKVPDYKIDSLIDNLSIATLFDGKLI